LYFLFTPPAESVTVGYRENPVLTFLFLIFFLNGLTSGSEYPRLSNASLLICGGKRFPPKRYDANTLHSLPRKSFLSSLTELFSIGAPHLQEMPPLHFSHPLVTLPNQRLLDHNF